MPYLLCIITEHLAKCVTAHSIGFLPFQLTAALSHLVLITQSMGMSTSFFLRPPRPTLGTSLHLPGSTVSMMSSSYLDNSSQQTTSKAPKLLLFIKSILGENITLQCDSEQIIQMGILGFLKQSPTWKWPKCSKQVRNPMSDCRWIPFRMKLSPRSLSPSCTLVLARPTSIVLISSCDAYPYSLIRTIPSMSMSAASSWTPLVKITEQTRQTTPGPTSLKKAAKFDLTSASSLDLWSDDFWMMFLVHADGCIGV